ncbi:hypothetical protein C8F04DRAFT_1273150 [Mycena alexandri]|uniref:CCHC-type domain-containing protein n=1 Tax=Mycena alexandri TaxID=1745969 RepID=A0AAD6S6S3_9AGAR|nr:hypothetical protein C8F04DRAFT_1273150 [Mycena alexandri]
MSRANVPLKWYLSPTPPISSASVPLEPYLSPSPPISSASVPLKRYPSPHSGYLVPLVPALHAVGHLSPHSGYLVSFVPTLHAVGHPSPHSGCLVPFVPALHAVGHPSPPSGCLVPLVPTLHAVGHPSPHSGYLFFFVPTLRAVGPPSPPPPVLWETGVPQVPPNPRRVSILGLAGARGGHFRRSTPSRSASSKEFDWTNTKNRTDVCYRCGLPGHFAQYCISIMPDNVRQRILGRREPQANLADDFDTDTEFAAAAVDTGTHFALAVHDLPSELNFNTIDPTIRESYASALATPHPAIHESAFAVHVDPDIPPPSPTLTAATASVGGTPNKQRKKKKKKKKSLSPEEAHTAMLAQEIHDSDFSM